MYASGESCEKNNYQKMGESKPFKNCVKQCECLCVRAYVCMCPCMHKTNIIHIYLSKLTIRLFWQLFTIASAFWSVLKRITYVTMCKED